MSECVALTERWNMEPSILVDAGWVGKLKGLVCAPTIPTCNNNVYDYFIIHQALDNLVIGTQVVTDIGGKPHNPTRLLLKAGAPPGMVRQMKKPEQIKSAIPIACPNRPPSYSIATELSRRKREPDPQTSPRPPHGGSQPKGGPPPCV